VAGRVGSIEKSNDPIGMRTRNLPACSIMRITPRSLVKASVSKELIPPSLGLKSKPTEKPA
jgi:hypothetical protein